MFVDGEHRCQAAVDCSGSQVIHGDIVGKSPGSNESTRAGEGISAPESNIESYLLKELARHRDLEQVLVERQELEEKTEAQRAQILRLRKLLDQQQELLDTTSNKLCEWQEVHETQTVQIMEHARARAEQQDTIQTLEGRLSHLQKQLEQVQGEAARHLEQLLSQAEYVAGLEKDLQKANSIVEAKSKELVDTKADNSLLQVEVMQLKARVEEMQQDLLRESLAYDRMREQLQAFETAERRRFGYGGSSLMGESKSGRTMLSEASLMGDRRGDEMKSQASLGSVTSGRCKSPSAASYSAIPDEERNAFLSQFPMASRTERGLRNRMEELKKRQGPTAFTHSRGNSNMSASEADRPAPPSETLPEAAFVNKREPILSEAARRPTSSPSSSPKAARPQSPTATPILESYQPQSEPAKPQSPKSPTEPSPTDS
mmetsp:Transcript_46801/g.111321  ORF Transcript_46801/g.111321 Transcript_46801/m.111321 type:complete len:430 (-) Transcript_46801:303-1592(-)